MQIGEIIEIGERVVAPTPRVGAPKPAQPAPKPRQPTRVKETVR